MSTTEPAAHSGAPAPPASVPAIDVHPAMFRNHPFVFLLSVLLLMGCGVGLYLVPNVLWIAPIGIGLLMLLAWYVRTRAVRLRIDADQVHLEEGLLSKAHIDLDISQIRTVKVRQSFWNRVFRVGEITIYTAGDKPELSVAGIPDPNRIRDYVRSRREAVA